MLKYIELHGIFIGGSADFGSMADPLTEKQFALNTDTGELRVGPGLYQAIRNPGITPDIRVRVAATSNVTIATGLNAGDTVDGVVLATDDLVLLTGQTTGSQNGIYRVGATPARDTFMDEWSEVVGRLIYVNEGSTQSNTLWHNTNVTGGTLGSTSITFQKQVQAPLHLGAANQLTDVPAKSTPVDADLILIQDSVTGGIRKVTLANLKTYIG